MPIYEYECKSCHAVFEDWAKHVDDGTQEKPCPTCGGVAHRIMSQTSFALKGDGWYVTEYGAKKGIKEEGNMGSGAAEKTSGDSLAQPDTSTQPATPERGTPLQQGAPSTGPNPASAAPAEATKKPAAWNAGPSRSRRLIDGWQMQRHTRFYKGQPLT